MLQNTRVTVFTISELLRESQQGLLPPSPPPPQIRVKKPRGNGGSKRLVTGKDVVLKIFWVGYARSFTLIIKEKIIFCDDMLAISLVIEDNCVFFWFGGFSGKTGTNGAGCEGVHDKYGFKENWCWMSFRVCWVSGICYL